MGIRQRIAGRKRLLELLIELGLFGPMTGSAHAVTVPLIQMFAASRPVSSPRQNAPRTALLGERADDHQTAQREPDRNAQRKAEPATGAASAESVSWIAHTWMLTRGTKVAKAGPDSADVSAL